VLDLESRHHKALRGEAVTAAVAGGLTYPAVQRWRDAGARHASLTEWRPKTTLHGDTKGFGLAGHALAVKLQKSVQPVPARLTKTTLALCLKQSTHLTLFALAHHQIGKRKHLFIRQSINWRIFRSLLDPETQHFVQALPGAARHFAGAPGHVFRKLDLYDLSHRSRFPFDDLILDYTVIERGDAAWV
jgi:hypothetical protein